MSSGSWIAELLGSAELRPGISPKELASAEGDLRVKFPDRYCELLLFSNGLYGQIGRTCLQIYPLHEALETNDTFKEFTGGLFIFGSDGAGEAYVFDPMNNWKILMATFVSMGRNDAVEIAATLPDFVRKLAKKIY